jgi:mannitol/fructose-specific phosphotransferase system IIA component
MKILYYSDWFKEYTTNLAIGIASHSNEVTLIVRELSPEFARRRKDEETIHHLASVNAVIPALL